MARRNWCQCETVNFTERSEKRRKERRHTARTHGATLVDELRDRGGRAAPRRVSRSAAHHPRCLATGLKPPLLLQYAQYGRGTHFSGVTLFFFIIHFESLLHRATRKGTQQVNNRVIISFADISILCINSPFLRTDTVPSSYSLLTSLSLIAVITMDTVITLRNNCCRCHNIYYHLPLTFFFTSSLFLNISSSSSRRRTSWER